MEDEVTKGSAETLDKQNGKKKRMKAKKDAVAQPQYPPKTSNMIPWENIKGDALGRKKIEERGKLFYSVTDMVDFKLIINKKEGAKTFMVMFKIKRNETTPVIHFKFIIIARGGNGREMVHTVTGVCDKANRWGWEFASVADEPVQFSYSVMALPPPVSVGTKRVGLVRNTRENTCYLNAIMQVLFGIPMFRDFVLSLEGMYRDNMIVELCKLFKNMSSGTGETETIGLTQSFGWPDEARQIPHDADEFVSKLMTVLAEKLWKCPLVGKMDSKKKNQLRDSYKKFMSDYFGCCIREYCVLGDDRTFADHEFAFPEAGVHSVAEQTTMTEIIKASMKTRDGWKKYKSIPGIYSFKYPECRSAKLVPIEKTVNLRDVVDKPLKCANGLAYELFAVVVRRVLGQVAHFYVLIKDLNTNKWSKVDDASIIALNDEREFNEIGSHEGWSTGDGKRPFMLWYISTDALRKHQYEVAERESQPIQPNNNGRSIGTSLGSQFACVREIALIQKKDVFDAMAKQEFCLHKIEPSLRITVGIIDDNQTLYEKVRAALNLDPKKPGQIELWWYSEAMTLTYLKEDKGRCGHSRYYLRRSADQKDHYSQTIRCFARFHPDTKTLECLDEHVVRIHQNHYYGLPDLVAEKYKMQKEDVVCTVMDMRLRKLVDCRKYNIDPETKATDNSQRQPGALDIKRERLLTNTSVIIIIENRNDPKEDWSLALSDPNIEHLSLLDVKKSNQLKRGYSVQSWKHYMMIRDMSFEVKLVPFANEKENPTCLMKIYGKNAYKEIRTALRKRLGVEDKCIRLFKAVLPDMPSCRPIACFEMSTKAIRSGLDKGPITIYYSTVKAEETIRVVACKEGSSPSIYQLAVNEKTEDKKVIVKPFQYLVDQTELKDMPKSDIRILQINDSVINYSSSFKKPEDLIPRSTSGVEIRIEQIPADQKQVMEEGSLHKLITVSYIVPMLKNSSIMLPVGSPFLVLNNGNNQDIYDQIPKKQFSAYCVCNTMCASPSSSNHLVRHASACFVDNTMRAASTVKPSSNLLTRHVSEQKIREDVDITTPNAVHETILFVESADLSKSTSLKVTKKPWCSKYFLKEASSDSVEFTAVKTDGTARDFTITVTHKDGSIEDFSVIREGDTFKITSHTGAVLTATIRKESYYTYMVSRPCEMSLCLRIDDHVARDFICIREWFHDKIRIYG